MTNQRKLHAPERVAVRGETPYEPIKFPIPAGIGGLSAIATTRWCAHSDPVPVGLGALEGSIVKGSYSEKLKDPRWQKKRLEILQRDRFACVACLATEKTLHVHHCCYTGKTDPGDYESPLLITLCEDCHADVNVAHSPSWWWMNNFFAEAGSAMEITLSGHPEMTDLEFGPRTAIATTLCTACQDGAILTPLSEAARIIEQAIRWGVLNDEMLAVLNEKAWVSKCKALGIQEKKDAA